MNGYSSTKPYPNNGPALKSGVGDHAQKGRQNRVRNGHTEFDDVLHTKPERHQNGRAKSGTPKDNSQGSLDSPGEGTLHEENTTSGLALTTNNTTTTKDNDRKPVYGVDENEERGNWSGRFDFILSMLGYAVGLGNVWRFPYLAFRNGGGAFLLPYVLMMVIIGLPLFFLEASLGQFCSAGPMACWQFAPLFKGLGISMVLVSAMTAIYYNMILGWAFYYLFASFTSSLPWNTCDGTWNTQDCSWKLPVVECKGQTQKEDGTCANRTSGAFLGLWNVSRFTNATGRKRISPSEEYWNGKALALSSGIEELGQPKWDMTLSLLLAWIVCFLCLLKGIKTTGKVVYFTALFPYVVLFVLLIRGATLDHADLGIRYFIVPDFSRLADARVWKDAANQIFFSMSIAGGGLMTLSSYNRFHNNILRDTFIVGVGDTLTCLLGGFVIFSFLGFMAGQLGVEVKDVVTQEAGLAFIVYPQAVSSLPPATLWAILFFIMLLTLGLDSQFAMLETVLTGVLDQYPTLRPRKTFVVFLICFFFFLLGLPLACPGGLYLLQLMDNYVGGMTLIIIGFFEIVAIIYVYGGRRFCRDIHIMIGTEHFLYWQVTWYVLSPVTIIFIFVFMFVDYEPSSYGAYRYPGWADAMGWIMTIFIIIFFPAGVVYKIYREVEGSSLFEKVRLLTVPSVLWGPALPKYRQLVNYVDGFQVDPFSRQPTATVTAGVVNKAFVTDNGGPVSLTPNWSATSLGVGASRSTLTSTGSRFSMFSNTTRQSYESNV